MIPLLQEKEKLYVELKNILARQPGPEVGVSLALNFRALFLLELFRVINSSCPTLCVGCGAASCISTKPERKDTANAGNGE
jgi:hypothetical protein